MAWMHPLVFTLLTVGQVGPGPLADKGPLSSQSQPPVTVQRLPGLSIPDGAPYLASPTVSPTALEQGPGVEFMPPLGAPPQPKKSPELADLAQYQGDATGAGHPRAEGDSDASPRLAQIWGLAGSNIYFGGKRMAPNGLAYSPLATFDLDLNIGLLPNKKLYLFVTDDFWLQKATAGQSHGVWDFTKREFDFDFGIAWNYWGPMEARVFGYALNNLNRGHSALLPWGYNDGYGLENRMYFATDDIYDIPRQSFVSIGIMPSKSLTGADGETFTPGLFAHAHLTRDLNVLNSYVYFDGMLTCQDDLAVRLLFLEAGIAARPLTKMENAEFRFGITDTYDVKPAINRGMGYFGLRFIF